jgi:hypothetical protein
MQTIRSPLDLKRVALNGHTKADIRLLKQCVIATKYIEDTRKEEIQKELGEAIDDRELRCVNKDDYGVVPVINYVAFLLELRELNQSPNEEGEHDERLDELEELVHIGGMDDVECCYIPPRQWNLLMDALDTVQRNAKHTDPMLANVELTVD